MHLRLVGLPFLLSSDFNNLPKLQFDWANIKHTAVPQREEYEEDAEARPQKPNERGQGPADTEEREYLLSSAS